MTCIDIIKYGERSKIALGGTAANVMSFLSMFKNFKVSILLPKNNNNFFANEFKKRNIKVIEFRAKDINTPIIIENLTDNAHNFTSLCPHCKNNLKSIDLPGRKDANSIFIETDYYNLFFYDRISLGIKKIAKKNIKGWNFYEPNSMENYKTFIDNARFSNIVKFSNDRISESNIKNMLFDLQISNVLIVIITMGSEGLKYSIRVNGVLSEWIYIKPYKLDNITDASGAGDWLSTSFLFQLINRYPFCTDEISGDMVFEFLDKSQRIAAESCQYIGAHGLLETKKATDNINNILNSNIYPLNVFSYTKIFCPFCGLEL